MTIAQQAGIGRRKNAVARVYLRSGDGKAVVNGRSLDEYFHSKVLRMIVRKPFEVTGTDGRFDYQVTVRGGGHAGQAGAIRLGLSRALLQGDESLRDKLRRAGLLTVDARKKERKKYGQKGARARFQFSKR